MKKVIFFLVLLLSTRRQAFAQESGTQLNSDKIFEQPVHPARRFMIELDKGNKVQIELADINDLDQFKNMDSMLRSLMTDIEPLKDSLSDELMSKRIDYLADTSGMKKIRIQQFKPKGSGYAVKQGDIAALKLEQDTINYIGMVSNTNEKDNKGTAKLRYYRLSFWLNDISQLPAYLNGSLQDKIVNLKHNIISKWVSGSNGQMHLQKDKSVSAKVHKGYTTGSDYVALRMAVDVQNYKHYFVPSFSLGAALNFSNSKRFTREIGLFWEPQFLFARNSQGNLQTFRNDFLTLSLAQGLIKGDESKKEFNWLSIVTLGYMIRSSGNYYPKTTFRAGAGRLSLFEGKIKIEPVFYFNNFFKGVTPSIRLTAGF